MNGDKAIVLRIGHPVRSLCLPHQLQIGCQAQAALAGERGRLQPGALRVAAAGESDADLVAVQQASGAEDEPIEPWRAQRPRSLPGKESAACRSYVPPEVYPVGKRLLQISPDP